MPSMSSEGHRPGLCPWWPAHSGRGQLCAGRRTGAGAAWPERLRQDHALRTIAGLQPALGGQIDSPPDTIAYAGHADGLKATLSVTENLLSGPRSTARAALTTALERMNLRPWDRAAQNLSAGQKRRLGLARLMVTGRPVWVLDEPTVSLDAASVALFADVVRGHLAAGGMALMATHIDLGLPEARVLDLAPYKARLPDLRTAFDEAFL